MPNHASKTCRKCGEVKPLGEFYRDRDKWDGRGNICRDCDRIRGRERYRANREAKLEYQRQYYEANSQAIRDYQRQYREEHPDKIRERDRQYYETNRETVLEQNRRWQQANRDKVKEGHRSWVQGLRDLVFGHYGDVCACCGSMSRLGVDHVDGNGGEHRRELFGDHKRGGADRFYIWLIRNDFPAGYQTLCGRCNTSKGTGARCRINHDLEYDVENDAW